MKKFTKLFLSCAIVSVVAAASATMAFADGEAPATYEIKPATGSTLAGTYTVSSNDVTLNGVTPDANTQVTFLVYKQGSDATTVAADDVIGIDQFASGETGATSVQPTNKGLKANSVVVPAEGQNTYNVKVGYYESGTFKTASATFVTGQASGADYIIGDVNDDAKVTTTDANKILYFVGEYATYANIAHVNKPVTITDAKGIATLDKTTLIGDVNNDGKITTTDANKIKYFVGEYEEYSDIANSNSKVSASYDTEKVNTTVEE